MFLRSLHKSSTRIQSHSDRQLRLGLSACLLQHRNQTFGLWVVCSKHFDGLLQLLGTPLQRGSVDQLAQDAATLVRSALRKPNPLRDMGNVDVSRTVGWHWVGSINTCDKHRHNPTSWVLAKFSTADGRTALNWKLARADAQCSNNSHAD